MSLKQKLGQHFRERVKDVLIKDLSEAAKGSGNMQERTLQKLKDYLIKTRKPLKFGVGDIIKITIVNVLAPLIKVFKKKPDAKNMKKSKNNKLILFENGEE